MLATKSPLDGPPEEITEIQIQFFDPTTIQAEHYPTSASEMMAASAAAQSRSDSFVTRSSYSSSGESVNYESPPTSNTSVSSIPSPMMDPVKSMDIFKAYFFDRMEILQSLNA